MYLSGVDFYVLSDHFIVHQNHMYEEVARKLEVRRKYSLPATKRNGGQAQAQSQTLHGLQRRNVS